MKRKNPTGWIAIAMLLLACPAVRATASLSAYQVEAVFLFNFAQFVEWPADTFAKPDAPFVICVLGEDPFGSVLDNVVRSESVGGHPFLVKRFRDLRGITDCNILYIGQRPSNRIDEIVAALKGHSILTVSETSGEERPNVMIGLFLDNSRVRMRINLAAARANNLTISSKLLRPAEIVGDGSAGN